ncbi:IS66 family insertion sequence element accessory protein TnpB [Vibrio metschnikovii]|nr:IS66 family insertion sequence element accessory protein TnpB [Vibrio metschnikovii]
MTPRGDIYLVTGVTDMRKSIDGLSVIVSEVLELNPLSNAWFIFCNRQRDKLKILFWDTNGFWLYYRRLEKGRFKWPASAAPDTALTISQRQLHWLLDGLPLHVPQAHKPLLGLRMG